MLRNVVRASWLRGAVQDVQVIDASWFMPADNRKPREEFEQARIPGARFFDLDECVDRNSDLPHMMPDPKTFADYISSLGMVNEKPFVVYDTAGLFSAARVWYMLKAVGVEQAAILDGGLPAWKQEQGELESGPVSSVSSDGKIMFECAKAPNSAFTDAARVLGQSEALSMQEYKTENNTSGYIIDARAKGRFDGSVPDPRPKMRRGHIPCAKNIPFTEVLVDGKFRSREEIDAVFGKAGVDVRAAIAGEMPLTFSCGSGVTACIPLLAAVEFLGVPLHQCVVYDGSWSEWGREANAATLPVEITAKTVQD